MELIIGLLKQLATTLSPSEFLITIIIIVGIVVSISKYVVRLTSGKNGGVLGGIIGGSTANSEEFKSLSTRLNLMITSEEFQKSFDKLKDLSDKNNEKIELKLSNMATLKADLDSAFKDIEDSIDDVRKTLIAHSNHNEQNIFLIRSDISKMGDSIQKILSQVDKLDEFAKTSVPEFRGYHRDLAAKVGDLSRDIALVERTITAQINNNSAVKLR